jgi:hypothetical protein
VKLYFNGCSFVWGDELEDREQESFPYLLKEKFNCDILNDSANAASNQRILRTTLSRDLKDYFVIIGWSSIFRYEYFTDKGVTLLNKYDFEVWNQVTPGMKGFHTGAYLEYEWFIMNFINQVLVLQNYLKNNNIPYFFFLSFGENVDERNEVQKFWNNSKTDIPMSKWIDGYDEWFSHIDSKKFPSLFDNDKIFRNYCFKNKLLMSEGIDGHPTKNCHKLWAEYLSEELNNII